ncbi:MAG: hypothetical protein Q9220_006480 [cf. Caloplaca sp. 1 TL-2023]
MSIRSNVSELLSVLQEVFAREPPVISRQEPISQASHTPQQSASIPPPVPPLPPELGQAQPRSSEVEPRGQPVAPPRPPKAGETPSDGRPNQANGAPPIPPHPQLTSIQPRGYQSYQHPGSTHEAPPAHHQQQHQYQQHNSQRTNILRQESRPVMLQPHQQTIDRPYNQRSTSPVSPMTPSTQTFNGSSSHLPLHAPISQRPASHLQSVSPPYSTQGGWEQYPTHHQPQVPQHQNPSQQQPHKSKPQQDLLTSPFGSILPTPGADVAPPPVPPNPQKDALLQALSQTLTQQIQSTHASNMSAIPPLRAQQAALNETLDKINQEISQLSGLQTLLDRNEKILRQAMLDADNVLDDAKRRDVPAVEEVLVAPTVVAGQLYENVVEERVLEETRTVIGRALDKGRIGGDVWAKVRDHDGLQMQV